MNLDLVSVAALAQSCVSPKTADQKVLRISTDPSKHLHSSLDIILLDK